MAQVIKQNLSSRALLICITSLIYIGSLGLLWSFPNNQALSHDEAVYLTKARSWVQGTPADEYRAYRPIGMVVAGSIFLPWGQSENNLRLFGVFSGALVVTFIFLLFQSVFDLRVGIVVSSVVALSGLFMEQAPLFQNDLLSSGLLIGTLWLLSLSFRSFGKSKFIYLAPFFCAISFYLRYGVASTLFIIGIITLIFFYFAKIKDYSYKHLYRSTLIFIILLIPHFYYSINIYGNAFEVLLRAGEAAGREYLGEGLIQYIKWIPEELSGRVAGTLMIIGGLFTIVSLFFHKHLSPKNVQALWLGFIGVISMSLTGLLVHAEHRYVFLPIILLSGVGYAVIFNLLNKYSKIVSNVFFVCSLFMIGYFGVGTYQTTVVSFQNKIDNRSFYTEAASYITSNIDDDEKCAVWSAAFRPEISWYSKCFTIGLAEDKYLFEKHFYVHFRNIRYAIYFTNLEVRQLYPGNSEEYGVILDEVYRAETGDRLGDLVIYSVNKKSLSDQNMIDEEVYE